MVLLLFSKFSQQRTEKKVKKWQDLHIKVNGEQKISFIIFAIALTIKDYLLSG